MKILQLVTKRQYRGAEVFAANLSEELIKLGHEIIFVGLYENQEEILEVNGAINEDLIREESKSYSLHLIRRLVKLIKYHKPDAIQCNGSDTLKYMVGASFFVGDIPIIYRNISMISEWVTTDLKKKVYNKIFQRVAHVTSVGEEAIEDFIATFDYPRSRTSVIRRGIPVKDLVIEDRRAELNRILGLKQDDKIAIHIGNFSPEKNHQFLLEVFKEIKQENPKVKLICVGNGILFEEVKSEIKRLELEDTVFLLGFRKDIPEILSCADCFVLSSKVEGVPGVILEAATQKIPSVSTDVGGVSEVLKDNETGYLIQDFDKAEFKNKVLKILTDEGEKQRLGENAFELVLKEFNPVKNAKKFADLYLRLSGKGRKDTLRILQVIQKKQYRGAEMFCCQVSNHLLELGQEVEVTSVFNGNALLPFKGEICSLEGSLRHRYWDIKGWRKLSEKIREYQPDLVQANAADTLKYTVFSKMIFRWKTPIVYRNASTASFYIHNKLRKRMNAYLLRNVDMIISVSHASKKDLNLLYPFTTSKSEVIPVGIENIELKQLVSLTGKNILHVGSFTNEKNHQGLIRIFGKIAKKRPDLMLHLVGEGPLKTEIESLARKEGLYEQVRFWDTLKNPLDLIEAADVLVLPSNIEGLPGVLLEAMFCRTPVVAYDVGGISEIVTKERGFLIPKGEEDLFAETVLTLIQHPNLKIIENAHDFVISEYLNEKISIKFLKAYRDMLQGITSE